VTTVNDTASAQHALKLAAYRACQGLFDAAAVRVSFGHPGDARDVADIFAWTDVRTEQAPATISTNRSRDEDVYLTAVISCFRAGEQEDDLVPSEAATDLLRTFETYLRRTDPTLGGHCLWAFLDNSNSGGVTDKAMLRRGRLIQIEAEFKARVRITG
jgi:hypothetical protein